MAPSPSAVKVQACWSRRLTFEAVLPAAGLSAYEDVWPLVGVNTILNVVPQGERYVVERLGKLLDIKDSGWFLGGSWSKTRWSMKHDPPHITEPATV